MITDPEAKEAAADPNLTCAFCDKSRQQVRHMIARNSSTVICNECVFIAVGMMLLDTTKVMPATVRADPVVAKTEPLHLAVDGDEDES